MATGKGVDSRKGDPEKFVTFAIYDHAYVNTPNYIFCNAVKGSALKEKNRLQIAQSIHNTMPQ